MEIPVTRLTSKTMNHTEKSEFRRASITSSMELITTIARYTGVERTSIIAITTMLGRAKRTYWMVGKSQFASNLGRISP